MPYVEAYRNQHESVRREPIVTAQGGCSGGGRVKNAGSDPQQQLPFFSRPTNTRTLTRRRTVKHHNERYLQDILWKESLLAVTMSVDCETIADLALRLQETLPQNSVVTRQRNTSTIRRRNIMWRSRCLTKRQPC